jgi:hypothetical protein
MTLLKPHQNYSSQEQAMMRSRNQKCSPCTPPDMQLILSAQKKRVAFRNTKNDGYNVSFSTKTEPL